MAGKIVQGAGAGAGIGAAIGGPASPLTAAIGAGIGAAVGLVSGIFKSKKHYHLYYWDPVETSWKFVVDGHPSTVNPLAKDYQKQGVVTAIVRNVGDKCGDGTLAPKSPPAGYKVEAAGSGTVAGMNPWILAGIAAAGLLAFVLLKKRR